jgi:hypothetical protein
MVRQRLNALAFAIFGCYAIRGRYCADANSNGRATAWGAPSYDAGNQTVSNTPPRERVPPKRGLRAFSPLDPLGPADQSLGETSE